LREDLNSPDHGRTECQEDLRLPGIVGVYGDPSTHRTPKFLGVQLCVDVSHLPGRDDLVERGHGASSAGFDPKNPYGLIADVANGESSRDDLAAIEFSQIDVLGLELETRGGRRILPDLLRGES
jgi:hypothetical protein